MTIEPLPDAGEPIPYASVPVAQPSAPVTETDRIVTLDVLRGFAVLGILLVNIQFFAFTAAHAEEWRWDGLSLSEMVTRGGIEFFATFKFITLFSLLFGMGLALQDQRAAARGRPFVATYVRRLVVLLLIGLAHAILLWYGDVLAFYALFGFVALLMRNLSPRVLLIVAIILFLVPTCLLGGVAAVAPQELAGNSFDWDLLAKQSGITSPEDPGYEFFQFMADEVNIYQSGAWLEMIGHRAFTYSMFALATVFFFGPRIMAMFLLGIYFVRRGLFTDSTRHRRTYWGFLVIGLALGAPLQILPFWARGFDADSGLAVLIYISGLYFGSIGMALAYAGGVALVCMRKDWVGRLGPLAAVGRMALTNYLGHSLICGFIFYGYGLGYFDRLAYPTVVMIVMAIFAAQLVTSPIWLRFFKFGPMEWLWRSLSYWRLQPMRRRGPRQ